MDLAILDKENLEENSEKVDEEIEPNPEEDEQQSLISNLSKITGVAS